MAIEPIDLRSDTVTKPSPAMRAAMVEAIVGDDVYGEDPTVKELEGVFADLLGKEAALFVPSGTMANQIGIGVHAGPGDELICDATAHVYVWEAGGIARHWGVTPRTVVPRSGMLDLDDIQSLIRPDNEHYTQTRLISLENTHNRRGGKVHRFESMEAISKHARAHGLGLHLDGARLMNAVVASGIAPARWAALVDTVSVCFSKGLGAPVGSAIAGSREKIQQAFRLRKAFGGGMRQAGIIAAGALYGLQHNVERLAEDHAHAQLIAEAVEQAPGLSLESGPVETNLVWISVDPELGTAGDVSKRLRDNGVLLSALGPQTLRAVTHLDVSRPQIERAAETIERVAGVAVGT